MSELRSYASRYIVDVAIEKSFIEIGDSSRGKYYIDKADVATVEQFKKWFKNIFAKGIPGKLTVFELKKVEHDGQIDCVITKFLNIDMPTAEEQV